LGPLQETGAASPEPQVGPHQLPPQLRILGEQEENASFDDLLTYQRPEFVDSTLAEFLTPHLTFLTEYLVYAHLPGLNVVPGI
jgi:hypothetical protein